MQTKHIYIAGICAAAMIVMLIIAATVGQNHVPEVNNSRAAIALTTTEQPNADAPPLLAIESALISLEQVIPALKKTIEQNQQSTEQRIKAIEQHIHQLKLAAQSSADIPVQQDIPQPQIFSPEHELALAKERAQAQVAVFDQALEAEIRDEGWAAEMEGIISLASQRELYQGSTISTPSCKSTFCRFEAFHDGRDSKDNFELIRRELPNSYHMQHFDQEDGSSRTVMYFIREGEEMNNVIFNTLNPGAG